MTYLNDEDIRRLNSFKNLNRKIESLSVRALLQQMTHSNARIVYHDDSRKPHLEDKTYNISLTHSNNYTAILLNKTKSVGIDVEFMSHNIERVSHKFINDNEYITDNPQFRHAHLYVHWCAKEALYKICNKVDINFHENLTIKPFELDTHGQITGIVKNETCSEEIWMYYMIENNYVLAYCMK